MQPPATRQEAGVIVPVFRARDNDLCLLLVRRSERGIHGGQIAFPGGKHEAGDESILDTALREVWEEIGVAADCIEILGSLPPAETMTTQFKVFPFLGRMLSPGAWKPAEAEIIEIFEVPVKEFVRPEARGRGMQEFSNWPEPREVPFFSLGPHRVWGLTYRILDDLIPRLMAAEWKI
jgi:8-oxo-dGTP pyrophosphatase MutT (NUDIX family)